MFRGLKAAKHNYETKHTCFKKTHLRTSVIRAQYDQNPIISCIAPQWHLWRGKWGLKQVVLLTTVLILSQKSLLLEDGINMIMWSCFYHLIPFFKKYFVYFKTDFTKAWCYVYYVILNVPLIKQEMHIYNCTFINIYLLEYILFIIHQLQFENWQ